MTETLQDASYVLLGTKKKSGDWVKTPVWFAEEGGAYYMFSEGKAGKVKRLRNFDDATLSPCTVMGKPTGEQHEATALLLDNPAAIERAHQALLKKYGWQMRSLDTLSTLGGKIKKRQYIVAHLRS